MVSTRQHPKDFPPPATPSSANDSTTKYVVQSPSPTHGARKGVHTPSAIVLAWLMFSVPLVIWDTGYVLLRPHSMPGGKFHSPIWTPYGLYGTIDYIYGWPAISARNGFTSAQGLLNLFETITYIYYLAVVFIHGTTATSSGRASTKKIRKNLSWFLFEDKVVPGRIGSLALLIAFSGSVATFSKTVLYWCNEYFSGFANIGHNKPIDLLFLWIIPNGLWLIFPACMIYVFGSEIMYALETSTPRPSKAGRPKNQ